MKFVGPMNSALFTAGKLKHAVGKKKKTQTWIRKHGSKRIPSVYTLIISKIVDESNLFYESPRKMLEKISQASLE